MSKHKRKRSHRNKSIVISLFGLILLLSCGYAAFQTNISINAKGTIIENCDIGGLIVKTVKTGDGLYKDEYQEGKCVYKGITSNNYIEFNNETWRIVSKEVDGTLKIIKEENIGQQAWDDDNENIWNESSLNTYLNEEYLATLVDTNNIVNHTWNIGIVTYNNTDLASQILSENSITYTNKIGLITLSDYLLANSDKDNCGNYYLNNQNASTCMTTNWLFSSDNFWTISPLSDSSIRALFIIYDGTIRTVNTDDGSLSVRPALYLSSSVKLIGDGSKDNAYKIVN